ncbi:hypothetical protein B9Q17_10465 [Marinobacter vinifirmus]|uniref:Uncharacterized protein n=1 Tax=Marinobacter vinifirmus TaxID=355591 RepID=A0A7Z1IKX1_9GAMM|nr:hypothetical protein B9Q17_10465 [Marinobacter vinifirmus]
MFISPSGVGRSTQQARYSLLQLIDSLYEYRSIIDRTIHHSHFLCWEAKLSTEAESYKIDAEEWAK